MLSILNVSTKECLLCQKPSLLYIAQSNLNAKYLMTKETFNVKIINDIVYNETTHMVCAFKEYLIYDDASEFLRRFYKSSESTHRLPKIFDFFEKYSKVFPNYISIKESKYMFKNIERKQKLIDEQQRQSEKNKSITEDDNQIFTPSFLGKINKSGSTYEKSASQSILQSYLKNNKQDKYKSREYQMLMEKYLLKDSISITESSQQQLRYIGAPLEKRIEEISKPEIYCNTTKNSTNTTKKLISPSKISKVIAIIPRATQNHRSSCNNEFHNCSPFLRSMLTEAKFDMQKKITASTKNSFIPKTQRPQSTKTSRINTDILHLYTKDRKQHFQKNIQIGSPQYPIQKLSDFNFESIINSYRTTDRTERKPSEAIVVDGKIGESHKFLNLNCEAMERKQEEKFYKLISSKPETKCKFTESHTINNPSIKIIPKPIASYKRDTNSRNSATPILSTAHRTPHEQRKPCQPSSQAKNTPVNERRGIEKRATFSDITKSEKHSPSHGRKSVQNMDTKHNFQPSTMKAKDKGMAYSKSIGAFEKCRGRYDSVSGANAYEKKEPSLNALLGRRSASKGIEYMIPHMIKYK